MAKNKRGGQRPPRAASPQAAPSGARPTTAPLDRITRIPRRAAIGVVVVGVILVLGGAMVAGIGGPAGNGTRATPSLAAVSGVPAADITPQEGATRWQAGALLLDVREDEEWAAGHVPGAVHIPLGQLPSRLAELPADQTILVICRSGNRSQEGRDILVAAGRSPVASVDGGVRAWRAAGLPFEGEIA